MNRSPIDRLAAARPQAESRLDADQLYSRITAMPRPALRPVRRGVSRRVTVALAVAALAAAGAGTAYATGLVGWHDATTLVTTPGDWQRRYRDATGELTLPPGVAWPKRTLPAHTVTSTYQPGGQAVVIAQTAWECYWAKAIRTGDAAAGRTAHGALLDLLHHHVVVAPSGSSENVVPPPTVRQPVAVFADDGGYQHFLRIYQQAAAGHPAGLFQSCAANGPVE